VFANKVIYCVSLLLLSLIVLLIIACSCKIVFDKKVK